MMLVACYVERSKIQGNGVFAGQDIPKGTVLWQYIEGIDQYLSPQRIAAFPEAVQQYIRYYAYPHHEEKGAYFLDGDHCRFMNHSETPNTDFKTEIERAFALRDIRKGEEITCNYREFWPEFEFYEPVATTVEKVLKQPQELTMPALALAASA